MRKKLIIPFCGLLLMAATSCSFFNNDYDQTEEQFVSLAYKSPDADFSGYRTYVITDDILYVNGDDQERISNDLTDNVIALVAGQMNSLGYTRVADETTAPDLLVDLSYIVTTTTSIYPGYWWDWDYWYWWDWYTPIYPYYPYPMYPISTSYSAGSLIIEIVDMDQEYTANENVPIVWHGLVRGILGIEHTAQEREAAINQCFALIPPK